MESLSGVDIGSGGWQYPGGVLIDAGRDGGDIGCVLVNAVGISGNIGSVFWILSVLVAISAVFLSTFSICQRQNCVNGVGAVCGGARRQIEVN